MPTLSRPRRAGPATAPGKPGPENRRRSGVLRAFAARAKEALLPRRGPGSTGCHVAACSRSRSCRGTACGVTGMRLDSIQMVKRLKESFLLRFPVHAHRVLSVANRGQKVIGPTEA